MLNDQVHQAVYSIAQWASSHVYSIWSSKYESGGIMADLFYVK